MSSSLYLDKMRNVPTSHNPYYEFFRDSIGKGDNLYYSGVGDIYSSVPEFSRGYGVLTRQSAARFRPQLGHGWRDIFSSIFQLAKPLLKRGAKEAVKVASNVMSDTLDGQNIKQAMKKHMKVSVDENLPSAFSGVINRAIGNGIRASKQKAFGKRRRHQVKVNKRKIKKSVNKYPALSLIH